VTGGPLEKGRTKSGAVTAADAVTGNSAIRCADGSATRECGARKTGALPAVQSPRQLHCCDFWWSLVEWFAPCVTAACECGLECDPDWTANPPCITQRWSCIGSARHMANQTDIIPARARKARFCLTERIYLLLL